MTRKRIAFLVAFVLALDIGAVWYGAAGGEGKSPRFASERTAHKFLGATRVVIDDFDARSKDAASAQMTFDKNEVVFDAFGDPQVTAVLYKPVPVKLTLLKTPDPIGKDRRIFNVELPKQEAEAMGKNTLRLVTLIGAKSEIAGVRLIVVTSEGKVAQALELRMTTN